MCSIQQNRRKAEEKRISHARCVLASAIEERKLWQREQAGGGGLEKEPSDTRASLSYVSMIIYVFSI